MHCLQSWETGRLRETDWLTDWVTAVTGAATINNWRHRRDASTRRAANKITPKHTWLVTERVSPEAATDCRLAGCTVSRSTGTARPSPSTKPRHNSAAHRHPTGNREKSVKHRHPVCETSSDDIDVGEATFDEYRWQEMKFLPLTLSCAK